jgi:hypothetical protein
MRSRFYVKLADDRIARLLQRAFRDEKFPTLAGQRIKAVQARWDDYGLEIKPTIIKFDRWGRFDHLDTSTRGWNKVEGYELEQRVKRMRVPDLRTFRKARYLRNSDYWPLSDQDKAAIEADILRQKSIPILHA